MAIATPVTGGYGYRLVDRPHDRYMCKLCHRICRDPYLSVCCGYNCCKCCVAEFLHAPTSHPCPICNRACDDETDSLRCRSRMVPNKQADREIKSLRVICTNQENGCEWQGKLNDIIDHLGNSDGCQFEGVECTLECGVMTQRRYLTNHIKNKCPRRNVDCQHCHITGEYHFIDGEHKEQCLKFPLSCPNNCEAETVVREDMEAHRKECPLEIIHCEYYSMGCEERMERKRRKKHNEENMEEHLRMTKLKLSITENTLAHTTATTENRLNDLEAVVKELVHKGTGDKMIVSAKTPIHLAVTTPMTCPVIVKMSQYSKYRKTPNDWYSDSFYSSDKAYKMRLRVNVAGDGDAKGTHMSVHLYLMKGPYDDELTWPLRGRFAVTLLNQISDWDHHQIRVSYDNYT